MSDLPILIRPMRETDTPYEIESSPDRKLIVSSWTHALCWYSAQFSWIGHRQIKREYRKIIIRLMARRPELFRLLVNEDNEDQIFGWRCGDQWVTHFVFVKREFRGEGLASLLIDVKRKSGGWVFSHWTKDCERMQDIVYKPSLFRELINGLDQVVGCSSTEDDKHAGEGSADLEGGRDGKAGCHAAGVDA